ncbi:MAG: glycosyltransferase family 87 protein [Xanthobacteraceae bacterium]
MMPARQLHKPGSRVCRGALYRKQIPRSWVNALRNANWLTAERAQGYSRVLFFVSLAAVVAWIALSRGGLDVRGLPLGTDFISFYAASKLALSGHPDLVYNLADHLAAQQAIFGGAQLDYTAFFYPPLFLLICLPLALVPYFPALAAWLAITSFACWRTITSLLGDGGKGLVIAMLAFPGVILTILHGQNAFLSTALFGMGILWLDRRAALSGVVFGLLAFKPQLGLMIPVALIATGRWRTFLAAGCTVAAFVAVTAAVFGVATWQAFFAVSRLARAALEQDWIGAEKMQSAFAAVRLWHGSLPLAYGVQAVVALAACAVLILVMRKRPDAAAEGATLVTTSLLASPFLLDYDLMLLAIPLAWIAREARKSEWLPWEKSTMFAAYITPLLSRTIAGHFGIPVGPPVIFAMLLIVARRALVTAREEY